MTPKIGQSFTLCLKNNKQLINLHSNVYEILRFTELYSKSLHPFRHLTQLRLLDSLSLEFYSTNVLNDDSLRFFSS